MKKILRFLLAGVLQSRWAEDQELVRFQFRSSHTQPTGDANWMKVDFPLEAARLGRRAQTWRCGYWPSLQ